MEVDAIALAAQITSNIYQEMNLRYESLDIVPLEAEILTRLNGHELTLFMNYYFARLIAGKLRMQGGTALERSVHAYRSKFTELTMVQRLEHFGISPNAVEIHVQSLIDKSNAWRFCNDQTLAQTLMNAELWTLNCGFRRHLMESVACISISWYLRAAAQKLVGNHFMHTFHLQNATILLNSEPEELVMNFF
jgi:hypothetical protein